ncbi:MAG: nitrous oxide-stimulated promoter family protein [Clostridium sp.]
MGRPGRVEHEKEVIKLMIEIYCKKKHGKKDCLCEECEELLNYAHLRLSRCKFGDEKTTCGKCKIHCYKKDMRAKIKDVMRFSGPRLIVYKPVELIKHMMY